MNQFSGWKQIKFVTGNSNKVREAQAILGVELEQLSLDLEEIQTCDVEQAVRHKAEAAYRASASPVLVEDSGLVFKAWKGLPGALVKWFEKTVGLDGMIQMLDGFDSREAVAICMVAVHDGERLHLARGEVEGTIACKPTGQGGFGWDALFIPEGEQRTFGEMNEDEKNAISHRRRAFEKLKSSVS